MTRETRARARSRSVPTVFFAVALVQMDTVAAAPDFAIGSVDQNIYGDQTVTKSPRVDTAARRIFTTKLIPSGGFTLGAGKNGVEPGAEGLRLSLGDLVEQIPSSLPSPSCLPFPRRTRHRCHPPRRTTPSPR